MKFLDVEREDSIGDGAKTVPYKKCKLLKNKSGVQTEKSEAKHFVS